MEPLASPPEAPGEQGSPECRALDEDTPNRRGAILWWLGSVLVILLLVAMACFVGEILRTRRALRDFGRSPTGYAYDVLQLAPTGQPREPREAGFLIKLDIGLDPPEECVRKLGGAEKASWRLGLYLRMPRWAFPEEWNRYRDRAAYLLGFCGRSAVPALILALKDRDAPVRDCAARALGLLGPAAEDAIPALEETATSDPHTLIRELAREALRKIRSETPSETPRPDGAGGVDGGEE